MIISFFEEFPTKENLRKLNYVTWPTKLYIAARSVKEFNNIKSKIKNKNVKETVYWPILDKKEGYWISPFSNRNALSRIFNEVENKNIPIMIDAELPTTRNPSLYITQFLSFFRNKKSIQNFIANHSDVYVCEYYSSGKGKDKILSYFGLHFNPNKYNNKMIKMVYNSMHKFDEGSILRDLKLYKKNYSNLIVAYGTISTGIKNNEPILSLDQLEKDLITAKKAGINETIIYRLGGLDKKYCSVIKKFV